ncbi:hypothetical protein EHR04_01275 [Leptospira levettii]|uniref:Uncharacterized protein n=1 Tax=Leptospira levettii TaxID=2023178 RepID=A0A6H3NL56_9LEPT|nr:hypothetical protein [Leptospira levettii]MCW7467479.1 hypothetical protein [Leptospira levettii]MCW7498160.1 hypothetical protein [Leptospira levettii]MCW7513201.1 hypothetical protein [Leptospira levettii]MCW7516665.1 hypothetical protein [Leptospira levettii]TGL74549.1 hypothetical protein EHQ60_01105 [Leptospira levettii]
MSIRQTFLVVVLLFLVQCTKTSDSYEKCERADLDYLACSLVIYQSYTYCAESASAVTGSTETKASAKFRCDAERLVGSYLCEDLKKKTCGTK